MPRSSNTGQAPLIRHKGRWAATGGAVVVAAGALLSGASFNDAVTAAKTHWRSLSEEVDDLREGPARSFVTEHVDVPGTAATAENAYGTVRVVRGDLARSQFSDGLTHYLPATIGDQDCVVDAQIFLSRPRQDSPITTTELVGLPGDADLHRATEARTPTPKRGASTIINARGLEDGEYALRLVATREGAPDLRTDPVTLKVEEGGTRVTLNGRLVDCRVDGQVVTVTETPAPAPEPVAPQPPSLIPLPPVDPVDSVDPVDPAAPAATAVAAAPKSAGPKFGLSMF